MNCVPVIISGFFQGRKKLSWVEKNFACGAACEYEDAPLGVNIREVVELYEQGHPLAEYGGRQFVTAGQFTEEEAPTISLYLLGPNSDRTPPLALGTLRAYQVYFTQNIEEIVDRQIKLLAFDQLCEAVGRYKAAQEPAQEPRRFLVYRGYWRGREDTKVYASLDDVQRVLVKGRGPFPVVTDEGEAWELCWPDVEHPEKEEIRELLLAPPPPPSEPARPSCENDGELRELLCRHQVRADG